MHPSDSLLIDYVKRKLQLEVETSSLLGFIYQKHDFFETKSELWLETASIYLYSIVFSICHQKETDLFFQLIERELQRKNISEIIEIFNAFKLTSSKLEKINKEYKIYSNSIALDVSFQVSILVKVMENKLEIMLIHFLKNLVENKLEEEFKRYITADKNIKSTSTEASKAVYYICSKFH